MKTIHPGHLEHRFCIFGCQILCIPFLAIMPPVQSASQSIKKIYQMFKRGERGQRRFEQCWNYITCRVGHPLLRAVKGYKTKTGMWRTACSVLRGAAFSRRRFLFPQIGESRAAHKSGSSSIKISIRPRSNHSLALSLSHSFGERREVKTLAL